jgi:lipopolysaccharide/colanic/teichoic acid biosynthesis glycosyltransferase
MNGARETSRLPFHTGGRGQLNDFSWRHLRDVERLTGRVDARPCVTRVTKRIFDIAVSAIALLILLLPFLLVSLAIKLDSPGPVFYRVRRMGRHGRPFAMLKFRKMFRDADGMPLTMDNDSRLTRVGALLTRARLDELPQLWDVLRGRMSMVGPRPEDPAFVALHAEAFARVLSVRPGITGLSQLAFAEEHKILDQENILGDYIARILPQKIGLDMLYAKRHRMRLDVAVLGWTVAAILLRKPVAVHRSTGTLNLRRRPILAAVEGPLQRAAEPVADAA